MFATYGCLYGVGSAFMVSSYFLITAKNFRRWQSLAVGIVSVGGSIGVLIFGPLLQLLIDTVGWRGAYRIISVPFFVMACVCGAVFGDPIQDPCDSTPQKCTENPSDLKVLSVEALSTMDTGIVNLGHVEDSENTEIRNGGVENNKERKEDFAKCGHQKEIKNSRRRRKLGEFLDFSVFKVPSYTIAVISLTVMNFGHYIPQIHLVKYCLDLGISADSASRLFIFLGLSSCVARITTGRLCDVKWINTTFIYQFGDLLSGFATIVLPVIQSYTGLIAFAVIYGFADGIFITTMNSLIMFTVDEKRRAAAMGLGNCVISLGIAAGAPVGGYLADVFDCYTWPFFMAGILIQIAGLLPLVLFCLEKTKGFDLKKNSREEPLAIYRQHSIDSTSTSYLYQKQ
ncbi:hypothetical protein ACROYT_G007432 [Oculina patagonica]